MNIKDMFKYSKPDGANVIKSFSPHNLDEFEFVKDEARRNGISMSNLLSNMISDVAGQLDNGSPQTTIDNYEEQTELFFRHLSNSFLKEWLNNCSPRELKTFDVWLHDFNSMYNAWCERNREKVWATSDEVRLF